MTMIQHDLHCSCLCLVCDRGLDGNVCTCTDDRPCDCGFHAQRDDLDTGAYWFEGKRYCHGTGWMPVTRLEDHHVWVEDGWVTYFGDGCDFDLAHFQGTFTPLVRKVRGS